MTATRRLGTTQSGTRTLLLDAAERLLVGEGYSAVTSRRVAAEAGVKPQLVHYYFRNMDDLFVEVFRRRAEAGIQRFVTAMDVHPSLATVWRYGIDPAGTRFIIEFVALANHRKAIREEIARYARRFRKMQLDAITAILRDQGIPPERVPPVVALLAMTGVSQVMAIEEALGITTGHDQLRQFIEDRLDDAEPEPRAAVASSRRKPRTR
jgi:AcrR family transcriptional regulator